MAKAKMKSKGNPDEKADKKLIMSMMKKEGRSEKMMGKKAKKSKKY